MPGLCLVVEYRKNKTPACPQGVLNLLNLPEMIEPAVEPGFLSSIRERFIAHRGTTLLKPMIVSGKRTWTSSDQENTGHHTRRLDCI